MYAAEGADEVNAIEDPEMELAMDDIKLEDVGADVDTMGDPEAEVVVELAKEEIVDGVDSVDDVEAVDDVEVVELNGEGVVDAMEVMEVDAELDGEVVVVEPAEEGLEVDPRDVSDVKEVDAELNEADVVVDEEVVVQSDDDVKEEVDAKLSDEGMEDVIDVSAERDDVELDEEVGEVAIVDPRIEAKVELPMGLADEPIVVEVDVDVIDADDTVVVDEDGKADEVDPNVEGEKFGDDGEADDGEKFVDEGSTVVTAGIDRVDETIEDGDAVEDEIVVTGIDVVG